MRDFEFNALRSKDGSSSPCNRNTGDCYHPRLRKGGAIREPWCWGPRLKIVPWYKFLRSL